MTSTIFILLATGLAAQAPSLSREPVFAFEQKHNHASCIVELPNGEILVTWYRGTGERKADDVQIMGARLAKGESAWGPRFIMADTPGYPDCNPALFAAPDGSLWLFWPTILDHRWEGALLKFAKADDANSRRPDGCPIWTKEGVVHVTPVGFEKAAKAALDSLAGAALKLDESSFEKVEARSKDELYQRLGWMPRVHPTVLPSGRWLLPLYSDTFSCSIILRSDDRGATWTAGTPMIGFGNIQPSIVRKADGTLVAYMRDNGPYRKIRMSSSTDDGVTWSPVTSSSLPNPGAGIEAIRLASGHWVMVYNDTIAGRHSLAVSLSEDEGATWKITRHVARAPIGTASFHYPSIMQSRDGAIHVSYTHGGTAQGSTIEHARFDEAWIRQGDEPKPGAGE